MQLPVHMPLALRAPGCSPAPLPGLGLGPGWGGSSGEVLGVGGAPAIVGWPGQGGPKGWCWLRAWPGWGWAEGCQPRTGPFSQYPRHF